MRVKSTLALSMGRGTSKRERRGLSSSQVGWYTCGWTTRNGEAYLAAASGRKHGILGESAANGDLHHCGNCIWTSERVKSCRAYTFRMSGSADWCDDWIKIGLFETRVLCIDLACYHTSIHITCPTNKIVVVLSSTSHWFCKRNSKFRSSERTVVQ